MIKDLMHIMAFIDLWFIGYLLLATQSSYILTVLAMGLVLAGVLQLASIFSGEH